MNPLQRMIVLVWCLLLSLMLMFYVIGETIGLAAGIRMRP